MCVCDHSYPCTRKVGHTDSESAQHFWLGKTQFFLVLLTGFEPRVIESGVQCSTHHLITGGRGDIMSTVCVCVCRRGDMWTVRVCLCTAHHDTCVCLYMCIFLRLHVCVCVPMCISVYACMMRMCVCVGHRTDILQKLDLELKTVTICVKPWWNWCQTLCYTYYQRSPLTLDFESPWDPQVTNFEGPLQILCIP